MLFSKLAYVYVIAVVTIIVVIIIIIVVVFIIIVVVITIVIVVILIIVIIITLSLVQNISESVNSLLANISGLSRMRCRSFNDPLCTQDTFFGQMT